MARFGRVFGHRGGEDGAAAAGLAEPAASRVLPSEFEVRLRAESDDHDFSGEQGVTVRVAGFRLYDENMRVLGCDDGELVRPGVALCKLAGLAHHGNVAQSEHLEPLRAVEIVPEPTNEYDNNALRVEVDGGRLAGYVPASLAAVVRPMVDRPTGGLVVRTFSRRGERVAAEMVFGVGAHIEVDVVG